MSIKNLSKIIIILGPTASGKSAAAIKLAKKINGEIISADSRQIYKYLNIGSGKVTKKEMCDIKHYCLDIVDPIKISKNYLRDRKNFSVTEYLKFAKKAIQEILAKGKTPIICGGTGLYIEAILYGIPKNAKPNPLLRIELEKKEILEILEIIKKLNLQKYLELINNPNTSEINNKRRLIRKVEILEIQAYPLALSSGKGETLNTYDPEFIFIEKDKEELRERINSRLKGRLGIRGDNLIEEVKYLIEELKINPDWLISLGLEYKYVTLYLQNKITKEKMIEELQNKIWQYAKRQILWNKRYKML